MKIKILFLLVLSSFISSCSSLPGSGKVEQKTLARSVALQLMEQGKKQYDLGNYESALENYQSALYQYSGINYPAGSLQALLALSRNYYSLGDLDRVQISLSLAESLVDRQGIPEQMRNVYNHYADFYLKEENFEKAEEYCNLESDIPFEENHSLNSERLRVLGTIYKKQRDYSQAMLFLQQALDMDMHLNEIQNQASDYYLIASIHSLEGRYSQAVISLEAALEKDSYMEYIPGVASDLTALGKVAVKQGEVDTAVFYFRRAYLAWKGLGHIGEMDTVAMQIQELTGESFYSP